MSGHLSPLIRLMAARIMESMRNHCRFMRSEEYPARGRPTLIPILGRGRLKLPGLILAVALGLPSFIAGYAAAGSAAAAKPIPRGQPIIVFMTDFGTDSDAVPICKGVMLSIDPEVRIVDLTHQVTPYSIFEGARFLSGTTPYYPSGTIFLAVVDPTVGSRRKPVVVKSKRGQYFVLPDNGLTTLVQDRDGLESAREITNANWMFGQKLSSTFHGRDIFSPAAAHLARGDDWTQVGPEVSVEKLVRLDVSVAKVDVKGISAAIVALDRPFGSLISNIDGDEFLKLGYAPGDQVAISLGPKQVDVPFVKTFSVVPLGKPLLYIDSRGRVGLAINQGDFSKRYNVKPPAPLFIPRKPGSGSARP
jgi:S-adenosylmethionine hydrolase